MYSLVSTTVKSISTKLLVSFWRNTSIWLTMDSLSSSTDLSFLIKARTYLARAAGSASQLRGIRLVEYPAWEREFSSYSGSRWEVSQLLSSSCFSISILLLLCSCFDRKMPFSGCSERLRILMQRTDHDCCTWISFTCIQPCKNKWTPGWVLIFNKGLRPICC